MRSPRPGILCRGRARRTARRSPARCRSTALDPGQTAALGARRHPPVHTPTLADVGGDPTTISTDPQPDSRLYTTSTTDALAQHVPFVLVIDSYRFRVTSACGKALGMATYLLDRWTDVPFIHLEPFRYSIVTDTPVIAGSFDRPRGGRCGRRLGRGGSAVGPVDDAVGLHRRCQWHGPRQIQGVMGTDDIDVIVSMLTNR